MAPKKTLTFNDLRRIGLALPEVEDGTAWGVPALRWRGKVLTCEARHRSAEAGSIVVMVPFDTREALIAEQPNIYYVTDHYLAHPCVVVRLARLREDALRDLLLTGQRALAKSGRVKRPRPTRSRRT